MKINEIMIGDWLNFLIDIEGGDTEYDPKNEIYQPMQVGSIAAWKYGGELTSDDGVINDIDQIQPIPLTYEILDKNFNREQIPGDPYGALFFYSNDYIEVYIQEYNDGLWQMQVDEIEMDGLPVWRVFVSNVHELQHALQLCGIDKEIKL